MKKYCLFLVIKKTKQQYPCIIIANMINKDIMWLCRLIIYSTSTFNIFLLGNLVCIYKVIQTN